MSTRIAAVVAAVAASAALPAVASAGTVPMRGVVSGSPYGASGGQMAVPVLFSKMTARNTGLRSPVGVIILGRTQKVKLPNGGGYTVPVNMRTGDRFKGFGVVGSLQKRVFYPRVVFPKATVYFRSKELSLSELSAAVDALRKAVSDLQAQLLALQNSTIKAFQDVYAQLADIRKALAGLQAPINFQSQIDALNSRIDALIASLPDFSQFALVSQLPDLSQYAKLTDVTSMINSAITGLNLSQYALSSTVSTLQTSVTNVTNRLDEICNGLKNASVDPDGAGPLPAVGVTFPAGTVGTACP